MTQPLKLDHTKIFWFFALLHLVCWTLVPWAVGPNAPLDVIEGFAWGHEWLVGTYKHPPMQAWWLEIFAELTNRAPWAHLLLSQIFIVTAFWAVWQLGRRLTDETTALLGALLLEGIVYYNYTTPEFNPNVLLPTFWALIGLYFHRAVKDNRLLDWILLGFFCAGGMYSKYSTFLFLIILFSVLVLHPQARRRCYDIGPWLTLIVGAALLGPHLVWLAEHHLQPFFYAMSRTEESEGLLQNLWQTGGFLSAQLLALCGAGLLFGVLSGWTLRKQADWRDQSFDRVFLHAAALGPFLALIIISLLGIKLRDMWGACLWDFIGLWALIQFRTSRDKDHLQEFGVVWGFVFVLILAAQAGSHWFGPIALGEGKRVHFPGQAMAAQIESEWNKQYKTSLRYSIGDTWLAGNLAYYAPGKTSERPQALIWGNYFISPWVHRDAVKRDGAVILWCEEHCTGYFRAAHIPKYILRHFPDAQIQNPIILPWQTEWKVPEAVIGWAIIPPKP